MTGLGDSGIITPLFQLMQVSCKHPFPGRFGCKLSGSISMQMVGECRVQQTGMVVNGTNTAALAQTTQGCFKRPKL